MRRIIESTLVSLDGVIGDPHTWATEYFDQEAEKFALELLADADAMLMGRRAYEFFAAAFPHQTGEYGSRINGIRKYVFSNTLKRLTGRIQPSLAAMSLLRLPSSRNRKVEPWSSTVMVSWARPCWSMTCSTS